jgi:uncharacterized protein DUF4397
MMQKRHWLAAVLVASFAIACSDSNGPHDTSFMRFVNASPDGPSIDAVLDNTTVQSSIAYANSAAYMNVDEDADNLTLKSSTSGSALTTHSVSLETGAHYTEILSGRATNLVANIYQDNMDDPSAGNVKVRFFQVAPSMPIADVYITNATTDIASANPTLVNISFRNTPTYLQITGGTYRIRLTAAGTKTVLFDVSGVNLQTGTIRSVLTLDKAGGGTPFTSLVLADKN